MTLAGVLIILMLLAPAASGARSPWVTLQASHPLSQPEPPKPGVAPEQDTEPADQEAKPEAKSPETQTAPSPAPTATPPDQKPQTEPGAATPAESTAQQPAAQTTPEPQSNQAPPSATTLPSKSRKRKPKPSKTIVREGGTSDAVVELSPGISQQQASNQKQNADQLIAATDENLKKIATRQLKPAEQETVNQIHNYLDQARAALKAGDLERSRNLAFKAHLLSADLLPH